jgi:hypothetical protein
VREFFVFLLLLHILTLNDGRLRERGERRGDITYVVRKEGVR